MAVLPIDAPRQKINQRFVWWYRFLFMLVSFQIKNRQTICNGSAACAISLIQLAILGWWTIAGIWMYAKRHAAHHHVAWHGHHHFHGVSLLSCKYHRSSPSLSSNLNLVLSIILFAKMSNPFWPKKSKKRKAAATGQKQSLQPKNSPFY